MAARLILAGCVFVLALAGCGGGDDTAVRDVPYSDVQSVFDEYGCVGCHPGVNASLDLRAEVSYDNLVGIEALLDPTLYRVVAGDPSTSFLYLKLGGDPVAADIPGIGTRMPPRAPPIAEEDLATVRDWILGGAKNEEGETGGPEVATPGTPPPAVGDTAFATEQTGTGTISGSVVDQRRDLVEGALVTMLLVGADLEGGEEHYRVALTDVSGRFTLEDAPSGRFLLKAYAPNSIYVSRIVALEEGESVEVQFGLPDRRIPNPTISSPSVTGLELAMNVQGNDLDGNYTLAVNPSAGLVFELHNVDNAPGRWSTTIERELPGPWLFLAVDENCNVSEFITLDA
ncbi:MAG TPA: carboxypeptidase-like regulatory domain-containing protein [Gaiellaceae bacterium]|nr:carboxypeptidase-like regulatory domain-containing protein [Gaiellaceae bacterium]